MTWARYGVSGCGYAPRATSRVYAHVLGKDLDRRPADVISAAINLGPPTERSSREQGQSTGGLAVRSSLVSR